MMEFQDLLNTFDNERDLIADQAEGIRIEYIAAIQHFRQQDPHFKFNYTISIRRRAYSVEISWLRMMFRQAPGRRWTASYYNRMKPNADGAYNIATFKRVSFQERLLIPHFEVRLRRLRRMMRHLSEARRRVKAAQLIAQNEPAEVISEYS